MARRGRPRRVGGPALQRRSGRKSRSHHPRAEKRSAADSCCRAQGGRAEPTCVDATSGAPRRGRKVGDAAEGRCAIQSGCARERNESSESNQARVGKSCIGKNSAGENKPSAAQRIKRLSEARSFATATLTALRKQLRST